MRRCALLLMGLVLVGTLLLTSVAYAHQARTDQLSRFHGKLQVTATYYHKTNRTVCDLRDYRSKYKGADRGLWHSHWRMKGKLSAKDCLEAWLQQ